MINNMQPKDVFLLVGMMVVLTSYGHADGGFCLNDEYVQLANMCYNFHQTEKNWTEAEQICNDDSARLVSIITRNQFDDLLEHITQNPGTYWLSGAERNGNLIWTSNGSPVVRGRSFWGNNIRPTPTEGECVYLCSNTSKLWAKECSDRKKFICQMDLFYLPNVGLEQSADDVLNLPEVGLEAGRK